ncbi:hypothetical protein Unana1_02526 [Umbelopsis nana]
MSALFSYRNEEDIADYDPRLRYDLIVERVLCELAGIFQNNQSEFGLGDLTIKKRYKDERRTMDVVRCQSSEELRALPALTSFVNYETDEKLSREIVDLVCGHMLIKDLKIRFGPKEFLTYLKELQAPRQEENWKILIASQKVEENWVPWMWIKDLYLLCENEFSSVYTAYIKPPFVGSHTSGQKVYMRKVKDENIAIQIYTEIPANSYKRDHFAITFDPEDGYILFIETPGEAQSVADMSSIEHVIATPFQSWVRVLNALHIISQYLGNTRRPQPDCHGELHPKNIFNIHPDRLHAYKPRQYIWHRAVRECHTDGVYGRLPYLPPEAVETDARPNIKWDMYAYGVLMWQMVSRVVFPPDQYMNKEVYQIDAVPGVPKWYEQLYLSCSDRDPSKRPEFMYLKDTICEHAPDGREVQKGYDTGLVDVDPKLLEYQKMRADKIKAHLEGMDAPTDLINHHTSKMYNRQEIVNEIGFNLISL